MKKLCFALTLTLCLQAVYGQSRDVVPLDDAIHNAALQIQSDLDGGSTVIVYQFQSSDNRLSNYILNELFDYLVNSRQFTVLDRGSQEVINAELNFQFHESAGMISDESLSSLTSRIGAQAIVTGFACDNIAELFHGPKPLGTYTLTFNANGGSGTMPEVEYTATMKYPLPKNEFTNNRNFLGWARTPNGAIEYADESDFSYKSSGTTVTLWARWSLIEMVWIEGGSFEMGKELGNQGYDDETPVSTVTLSGFWMGKYQVTQEEYIAIIGNNPSHFQGPSHPPASGEIPSRRPVEAVNWYDAVEFCNALSIQEGLTPYYTINKTTGSDPNNTSGSDPYRWLVTLNPDANGYRLPTEAQWEYAAKGGNGSPGNFTYSGSNNINDVGWYYGNSDRMREVGKKQANGLGLYDMSGNVWEWCWDWYGNYTSKDEVDPTGPSAGSNRVRRGGAWWINEEEHHRSTYRNAYYPNGRFDDEGFRLIRPGN